MTRLKETPSAKKQMAGSVWDCLGVAGGCGGVKLKGQASLT